MPPSRALLLAEKLLLVSLDPRSGYRFSASRLETHLAAALLLELDRIRRITVHPGGPRRRARVTLTDASPTGDDLLGGAQRRRDGRGAGRGVSETLTLLPRRAERALLTRLVARAVLQHEVDRFWLVLRNDVWTTVDRRPQYAPGV